MFAKKTHLLVHRSVEPLFNFYSSGEVDSHRGMELSSAPCNHNRGFIFWYTGALPGGEGISADVIWRKNMKMRREEDRMRRKRKKA